MSFITWLNENTSSIQIDDTNLVNIFRSEGENLSSYIHQRHFQVQNFQPETFFNLLKQKFNEYPKLNTLLRVLSSKNPNAIFQQERELYQWLTAREDSMELRPVFRQISLYQDFLQKEDPEVADKQIEETIQQALLGTKKEMLKLKSVIEQAISRIHQWNNYSILIQPEANQNEMNRYSIETTNSALVTLGQGHMAPNFMIFQHENQMIIDDVIEGGDTDFFATPQIQSDYFNLINELKNPGSTSKGKVLTLYTARPKKDREEFLQSQKLPINIFLANNYNHVEGLAQDLGGERDIWKVRIDSRYLTQTLNGPIKYYQITTPEAPVQKMELL